MAFGISLLSRDKFFEVKNMNYYDGMGKNVTDDVLRWKQAFEAAQPQPQEVKTVVTAKKAVTTKKKTVKATSKTAAPVVVSPPIVEDDFNPVAVGGDADSSF
jgi:hypothetical protein